MLTFDGRRVRHCDGLSRRGFLRAGTLGAGGLTLAGLLRAEAAAGAGSSNKAVINIHLDGGPPQMDLIDPKPDAPAEYRGPFKSLPTTVPGLHLTELMPKLAGSADRFAFVRSLVGAASRHDAFQCMSGFPAEDLAALGGRPALGCVVGKLLGRPSDPAPPFIDLMQGRPLARNSARPGFLGPVHGAFRPDLSKMFKRTLEDGMKIELARLGEDHTTSLSLAEGITAGRLGERLGLLRQLDRTRRAIDQAGSMAAMDRFTQQAYGILTSGRFAAAMDLSREAPRVLERYRPGPGLTGEGLSYTSDGPEAALKLLLARRLVEAGVRCVSVSISDFDTHKKNFPRMRQLGPLIDHALHALVTDLEEKGMLDDVTVLAWGEFGRTPKVNKDGGRDHWPKVGMAVLAGGGMNVGQVIGSTDRIAGEATSRPVHYQDIIATVYHNLGIDPRSTTVDDPSGRPRYLVESGRPVPELVG